jgi:hypothetical protein
MKTRHVVRQKGRRTKTEQRQPTKINKQTRLENGGKLKTGLKLTKKKQTYVVR